jgi:plasmid stabilization system protein ParE
MKLARFSQKAQHDLDAIFRFIAGDNLDAAKRFFPVE